MANVRKLCGQCERETTVVLELRAFSCSGSHGIANVLQDVVDNPKEDPSWHYANEFPDFLWVNSLLKEAGFRVSAPRTLYGPYISEHVHNGSDPEFLFSPEFRAAESVFQMMEQKGLTAAYDRRLRELIDSGTLQGHIDHCELARKRLGVAYYVRAVKPKH